MLMHFNKPIKGSPMKLKNGEWGVRLRVKLKKGTRGSVLVQTRSGKQWESQITVIYSGDGYSVCTINNGGNNGGKTHSNRKSNKQGYHTSYHCSCGNWSGVGSPCLYSFEEAVDEGEARYIDWR